MKKSINTFIGNHKEIGAQIGQKYRAAGTTISDIPINQKLLKSQIALYKKYYPHMLTQLTAIAEAAHFNVELFLYHNLCAVIDFHRNLSEKQKGCTIFGVKNKDGTYIGRNYDWKPGTENYFQVLKTVNPDAFDCIGITDMDYFTKDDARQQHLYYEVEDVINDKGLYIGLTFAYSDSCGVGLSPIHMNQLVAETCSTVEQALKVFDTTPLAVPKNYFIADASGEMAVVEHTSQRHKVLRPLNDVLVQTNHYLDPELASEDTVLRHHKSPDTFKRYAEALETLTVHKDTIHQIGAERVLRNPESDIYETHRDMKTIWSLAFDMNAQSYRLYWKTSQGIQEQKLSFTQ